MAPKSSKELLQEHLEAQRRAFLAKAKPVTDAEVPDIMAAARSKVFIQSEPEPRTADPRPPQPMAIRIALDNGQHVFNAKIWAEDVKRFIGRKFAASLWVAEVRALARRRAKGEVLEPTIVELARNLQWETKTGDGKAQITFALLAAKVGCCIETARKAIRWLEACGFIDTFNVISRAGGNVRRDANLYMLRMPEKPTAEPAVAPDAEPDDPPSVVLTVAARVAEQLARWASLFDLVARPWGLNATPIASYRARRERNPNPA